MKMPYISIQWKLIVVSGLLVAASVATLGVLSYRMSEEEIYQVAEENFIEQLMIARDGLETAFEVSQQALDAELAAASASVEAAGMQEVIGETAGPVLEAFAQRRDSVMTLYRLSDDGAEAVGTNAPPVATDADTAPPPMPADSPIVRAVMQGNPYYEYLPQEQKDPLLQGYAPIMNAERVVIGMLRVTIPDPVDAMLDRLAEIEIGKTGYIGILSANAATPGAYVLSLQRQREGESILEARDSAGRYFVREWVERAPTMGPDEYVIDYYPWKNPGETSARSKIAAYTYLPQRQWILVSSAYIDDFQDSLGRIRILTYGVSGGATLVSALLAFAMARFIVGPIRLGVQFAAALAAGNFSHHMRSSHHDETALLARALNTMRDRIAAVLQEITRLIQAMQRGQLEERGAPANFAGDWGTLVAGINDLIEAFVTPIQDTGASLRRIASGDIPDPQAERYAGDFNQITRDLNRLTATLRAMLAEIRSGAGILVSSVQDLSVTSQEISSTSQEQAAAIKEIVSTMEDSDQLAHSISAKISDVTSATSATQQKVTDGFAVLSTNLDTMNAVKQANTETITGIRTLSEQIESIWDILSMIKGVADQTKIIAFNAELEASAAGEAGKNFQIVASEIRRLADSTVSSTTDIKDKIQEIQQSADALIRVSEEGSRQVMQGWELSNEIQQLFESIQGSADVSAHAVERIALSIQQQVGAFEQIVLTLRQISEGVDNFVVSTTATTATTETLRGMAGGLHAVIEDYVGQRAEG